MTTMNRFVMVFVMACALVGCDDGSGSENEGDRGFMTAETPEGEVELHPGTLPITVGWDDTWTDPGVIAIYMDAVSWVNFMLGDADGDAAAFVLAEVGTDPDVAIETGYAPVDSMSWPDDAGRAQVFFDETGAISGGIVSVSIGGARVLPAIDDRLVRVVMHNLLHVLGLDDDPEGQSIMYDPLDTDARLTPADFDRLQPYLPE